MEIPPVSGALSAPLAESQILSVVGLPVVAALSYEYSVRDCVPEVSAERTSLSLTAVRNLGAVVKW